MKLETKTEFLAYLSGAQDELSRLARETETDVQSVSRAFRRLASQADLILKQAAAIVQCVENENMHTVLATIRSLCLTVRNFLERRLKAVITILEMLESEGTLLGELAEVTDRQPAIAFQLKAMSVHTNVEVAQLGTTESDFQLLAAELSEFSTAVSRQTLELANHTANRRQTIERTRKEAESNLTQMRNEMKLMEDITGQSLDAIDAKLRELAKIPEQFRVCAEHTAQQIAGVVAAIQSHDITRQQIEHVQQGLQLIATKIKSTGNLDDDQLPLAYAGLTIQSCQLKTIRQTVASWTSQIKMCMDGIRQLSASEVVGIGAIVLAQEQDLSAQLAHIELVQQTSQDYGGKIRQTLEGLSGLLELVNEYLQQSQTIGERLQLLTFNSLFEAHRLGRRGAVVAAIANIIERVFTEWNEITAQARLSLGRIQALVKSTDEVMGVFSEASGQDLRQGQTQTKNALYAVRTAAAFVAGEAAQMQTATARMQTDLSRVETTGNRLDSGLGYLETALNQIEALARRWEAEDPHLAGRWDAEEAKKVFSTFYTTEIERDVMHAALSGTQLPVLQQSLVGNAVELF